MIFENIQMTQLMQFDDGQNQSYKWCVNNRCEINEVILMVDWKADNGRDLTLLENIKKEQIFCCSITSKLDCVTN